MSESLGGLFERTSVFRGLDPTQRAALIPLFQRRSFAAGEAILKEGERDPNIYLLWSGRAEVVKATPDGRESHVLTTLVAGESVGEMKLADEGATVNSATVIAKDDVVAWSLRIDDLDGVNPALRSHLTANIAKVLADRLRTNNDVAVEAMQQEFDETRERVSGGIFAISLIALTAVYSLSVSALKAINPSSLPKEAFLSPIFIITPCIPIVFLIRAGHRPARDYGLVLEGWPRVVRDAVTYTLPFLLALTALKAIWITFDPRLRNEPLFDTMAIFDDGRFDLRFYVLSLVIYTAVCPAQEFFTRSGLQTALDRFMPRSGGRANWTAIIVSNLVFALAHTFIGFGFAVAAFVPGIFWGWLYDKQRSLIGVTVSHALVGVWALQILGVQPIIGGH